MIKKVVKTVCAGAGLLLVGCCTAYATLALLDKISGVFAVLEDLANEEGYGQIELD